MINKNECELLEKLIDREGLTSVFDAISEICYEKSEYIASNYNDITLANQWQDAGAIVPNSEVILPS